MSFVNPKPQALWHQLSGLVGGLDKKRAEVSQPFSIIYGQTGGQLAGQTGGFPPLYKYAIRYVISNIFTVPSPLISPKICSGQGTGPPLYK